MTLPALPTRLTATLLVALALTAAGCSKGGEKGAPPKPRTTTTTQAAAAAPTLAFTVTQTDDNGTKTPDEATVAAVKKTLDGWLAGAVVAPLHSGQPAPDLAALFTPAALERLTDPATRATLVDEGLPPATKAITAEVANLLLSSVAGPDEVIALIGARIDLKVHAVGPTVDADVVHQGELVLVPDPDGSWKIDSFAIHTARDTRP